MPEPSLHHVGYVVGSIADGLDSWRASLAATSVSAIFEDPLQRARVVFLDLPPSGEVKVELVEPAGAESPVAAFLAKGGGLHHLCFEVDDLETHLAAMRACKAMLIRHPKPAVAFNGRRIAWMFTADKLLVEYLERTLP